MVDNINVVEQIPPAFSISRPRLVNSNVHTIDITNNFRNAASKLSGGILIKDEHFTLFESVGALEIGDPKMDSGSLQDEDDLEVSFNFCRPLMAQEVIWLMDELLSREVAWHMGYPLSQTLFTSVYIEKLLWPDPTRLEEAQFSEKQEIREADPMLHKLFRSYCLGLVKSCDLVLGMVTGQHYYEEEDFATQLYNRELLHRFAIDEVLAEMENAAVYLQGAPVDATVKQSLGARMQFRSGLLNMLSSHASSAASPSLMVALDQSLLTAIQTSRNSGKAVQDAFTLKIQRKLASTVPPRPMVTIDEERTFDYLHRFIRDCGNVFSVLCASHSHDLLLSYSLFCSQDPQPSVYVRALLQSWLGKDEMIGGISNDLEFISSDVQSLTLAGSPVIQALHLDSGLLNTDLSLARQHLHDFFEKNTRSFLNIWRTTCLNRCRVRRTLCHAALEWDQIQAEAEELDDELQQLVEEAAIIYPIGGGPTFSYGLSSWIYHYKLTQLRLVIQMGFELELYAPHELPSMYWYLGHLCDIHLAHLERISFFTSGRQAAIPPLSHRSLYETQASDQCHISLLLLYRQFSWLKATEALATALHCLYVVLQRHGQIQQPAITYASDNLRYELRMRPFLHLSIPEPISFEQCRRRSLLSVRNDSEILEEASSYIAVAKKGWEEVNKLSWHAFPLKVDGTSEVIDHLWKSEVRGAVKATIGTSIAIMTLKRLVQDERSGAAGHLKTAIPVRGEKDFFHHWWLVPRLTIQS